jgi:hypothetical protein
MLKWKWKITLIEKAEPKPPDYLLCVFISSIFSIQFLINYSNVWIQVFKLTQIQEFFSNQVCSLCNTKCFNKYEMRSFLCLYCAFSNLISCLASTHVFTTLIQKNCSFMTSKTLFWNLHSNQGRVMFPNLKLFWCMTTVSPLRDVVNLEQRRNNESLCSMTFLPPIPS